MQIRQATTQLTGNTEHKYKNRSPILQLSMLEKLALDFSLQKKTEKRLNIVQGQTKKHLSFQATQKNKGNFSTAEGHYCSMTNDQPNGIMVLYKFHTIIIIIISRLTVSTHIVTERLKARYAEVMLAVHAVGHEIFFAKSQNSGTLVGASRSAVLFATPPPPPIIVL